MSPSHLRATAAYRSIGVETRVVQPSQHELANMMFDVTLESLAAAQGAIAAGNVSEKVRLINKALRIIQDGLRTSLDLENGGELAANLDSLYDYCVLRLTLANAHNDASLLHEVVQLIKPVADAWKQIAPGGPTTQPAPAAAMAPASVTPAEPLARKPYNPYQTAGAYAAVAGA
jgi:flagellar protein FliS